MKQLITTPFMKITFILGFALVLVVGVLNFQQAQSDIKVEGFLDAAQKISYGGGTVADSYKQYYAVARWHGNHVSREEIDYYVTSSNQAGQELIKQGVKKFYVGVTFRRYLSPEEFEQLVKDTGVESKKYILRATFPKIDPKVRVGLFGRSRADLIIDPKAIERAQKSLRQQAHERKADQIAAAKKSGPEDDEDWQDVLTDEEFKAIEIAEDDAVLNGVFTFEAVTDIEGYQKLRANPLVYHVDVTAVLVFQQLKEHGVKWADYVDDLDLSDPDPFVNMERIGLDEFR